VGCQVKTGIRAYGLLFSRILLFGKFGGIGRDVVERCGRLRVDSAQAQRARILSFNLLRMIAESTELKEKQMKSAILALASVGMIVVLVSVAPDIRRYFRMMCM
jgi:hypothetical protein